MYNKLIFFIFLPVAIISSIFLTDRARALDFTHPVIKDDDYQAQYISQSIADPIIIEAGATKEVVVKFKNIGSKTWNNVGYDYVSVYTINDKYRSSQFANSGWLAKSQPAKLSQTTKSGDAGEFKIKLTAPAKTGEYKEDFYLAAENTTWIKSGYFFLKIKVTEVKSKLVSVGVSSSAGTSGQTSQTEGIQAADGDYQASVIMLTADKIQAVGGDRIKFFVVFNNSGKKTWNNYVWSELGSLASGTLMASVDLADQSWANAKKIMSGSQAVKPEQTLRLAFYFRAPARKGIYTAKFRLSADDNNVSGGSLSLPVEVTADAPVNYQVPVFAADVGSASARALVAEPKIRVGLYSANEAVKFISPYPYSIYADSELKGLLPPNTLASLSYSNGAYGFSSVSNSFTTDKRLRLVADDPNYYFTISNYDRRVSWRGNENFNSYRDTLELKYSPRAGIPYVVNELALDAYVAGIAETTNDAYPEYAKAVLVAARSYAYYHINNGVPKDQRTFDVYATTVDQLYLGYNSEVLMPNVVKMAKATYGEMVTYQSQVVTTPYFGHSDGSTRTWSEVWGGADKPWLKRVEAKYDQGLSMYGHGVGMSTRDASLRATNDGWNYQKLLKYYYTGVEVEKVY